ncbi:Phosphoglycerate dehydrogenase [Geodermatophilus obscurus]|uniref:Phosphoglycerate dehydrogenase n=1 Tax=Geodermatophilus obscurus TaxID=1861 RepID=A0A1I5CX52_9ACTN|nr:NAD(P)-dependent oxidoreductase [Geodermatophilus obscurus]SFN91542.1 Phosphoglycerate dehydrogenase [Geodermatophilus obscurus]
MASPRRAHVVVCVGQDYAREHVSERDLARLREKVSCDLVLTATASGAHRHVVTDPAGRHRLRGALRDADALVLGPGAPYVDAAVLADAPRLRLVGELEGDRFSPRLDLQAAWARGITAVDTSNASSYPVAEWAVAALILCFRNAGAAFREMIEPQAYVRPRTDPGFVHGGIEGRTIGLLGCGHIGRRLVRYLQPFGVDVLVHDPHLDGDLAEELGVELTSLDGVFDADGVVCLLPLTPATRGLVGAAQLQRLRPGAALVNVSRGAVVDGRALLERLLPGDVFAALDVFDPEPVPADHPIKSCRNVFLTPHIAGVTARSRPQFFALMVDELLRFTAGRRPRYELTPTVAAVRGLPAAPRGEEHETGRADR